uniref:Cadherin domain-containing protein n=1 Tax=Eptatretus burgeri TaxID=7764 RepID=A0A8C4R164_EPTBU
MSSDPHFKVHHDGSIYVEKTIQFEREHSFVVKARHVATFQEWSTYITLRANEWHGQTDSQHHDSSVSLPTYYLHDQPEKPLKREKRQWTVPHGSIKELEQKHLILKGHAAGAEGHDLHSTGDMTLQVSGINDNYPVFMEKELHATVAEGSPPGTHVLKISPKGFDMHQGKVTFKIVEQYPNTHSNMFSISEHNGVITTASHLLDRETVSTYKLKIKASDCVALPCSLHTTSTVIIKVTDINDHPPVITSFQVLAPVKGNKMNETVAIVTVEDKDEPYTDNWKIKAKIVSGNSGGHFGIRTDSKTNNAFIYLIRPLDVDHLDAKQAELKVAVQNVAPVVVFYPGQSKHLGYLGHHSSNIFQPQGLGHYQPIVLSHPGKGHGGLHGGASASSLSGASASGFGGASASSFSSSSASSHGGPVFLPGGVVGSAMQVGGPGYSYGGLATYGVQVISDVIQIPIYKDPKISETKLVVYKEEGLKAGSVISSFVPVHLCGKNVMKYEKLYDPQGLLEIDSHGSIKIVEDLDREAKYIHNNTYQAIFLAVDDAPHPCTATATLIMHVADVNDHVPLIKHTDDIVCKKEPWNSILLKAYDEDQHPYAAPFTFKLMERHDSKNMWQLKTKDEHSAILTLVQDHVYSDSQKVAVNVKDAKGLGETHFLHLMVCECHEERSCIDKAAATYGLSPGALAAIILSLILVPLALLLGLLASKMKKKNKKAAGGQKLCHMDKYTKGDIQHYNKECGEEDQTCLQPISHSSQVEPCASTCVAGLGAGAGTAMQGASNLHSTTHDQSYGHHHNRQHHHHLQHHHHQQQQQQHHQQMHHQGTTGAEACTPSLGLVPVTTLSYPVKGESMTGETLASASTSAFIGGAATSSHRAYAETERHMPIYSHGWQEAAVGMGDAMVLQHHASTCPYCKAYRLNPVGPPCQYLSRQVNCPCMGHTDP